MNATYSIEIPTKADLSKPVPKGGLRYRLFFIEPKRDFGPVGHFIDGKYVKKGWLVTDGGICNVMPGATWFRTIKDAKHAIDVLIAVRGNVDMFWEIMQPFQETPGMKAEDAGHSKETATASKGRHWARYENGICVEVGITLKPVYA